MIKLPKEVARIMKTLTDAKQEAFAVGDCVRDALLGQKPIGWDIATDAGFDKLRELFPEAKVLSETYSILRMEFIEERYDDEGKFAGEDGIIIDVGTYRKRAVGVQADQAGAAPVQFSDRVEDDVARRAFTINAIADNPYQLVDPYNGPGGHQEKTHSYHETGRRDFLRGPNPDDESDSVRGGAGL